MIYFPGDIYGSLADGYRHVLPTRPTAVVLLGDIEPSPPFDTKTAPLEAAGIEVYWIRGIHDTARLNRIPRIPR